MRLIITKTEIKMNYKVQKMVIILILKILKSKKIVKKIKMFIKISNSFWNYN